MAKKKKSAKKSPTHVLFCTPMAKKKKSAKKSPIHVLFCTEWRGVFMAELIREDRERRIVEVKNVQNCLRWTKDSGGVFGLAQRGPTDGAVIGGNVTGPETFYGVTCVLHCTPEAVKAWRGFPCL